MHTHILIDIETHTHTHTHTLYDFIKTYSTFVASLPIWGEADGLCMCE